MNLIILERLLAAATLLVGATAPSEFSDYWNRGLAEITSYELEQARYGELHSGHAVLVFVTEPFSTEQQVKADHPSEESVEVLKLNLTKKFNTGVYPYSMMLSVFTPTDTAANPRALKATVSSQEWCGHTFAQLNLREDGYHGELRSYFQSEGDRTFKVGEALMEDELWARIRIAPGRLPTGKIELIPSGFFSRLSHQAIRPARAEATLAPADAGDGLATYSVRYPDLGRSLTIRFSESFPHTIESWEETSSGGSAGGSLTTRAKRKSRMMLDYWRRNGNRDRELRAELDLPLD